MRCAFLFAVGVLACTAVSATTYFIETNGTVSSMQMVSGSGLSATHVGDTVKVSFAVETNQLYPGSDGSTFLEYFDFSPDLQGGIRSHITVGARVFNIDKYPQAEQFIAEMENSNILTGPTLPATDLFFVLNSKMQDAILLGAPVLSTPFREVFVGLEAAGTSKLVTGPVTNFARNVRPSEASKRTGVLIDGTLEVQSVVDGISYVGFSADTAQVFFTLDKVTIHECHKPFAWLIAGAPWPAEVECE